MTGLDALVIEPLGKRHDRAAFSCELPELDRYLARQAGQDVRRRIARVFVCTAEGADTVLGFYTLSTLAIDLSSLPEELSPKAIPAPAPRPDRLPERFPLRPPAGHLRTRLFVRHAIVCDEPFAAE